MINNQTINLCLPQVVNDYFKASHGYQCQTKLPETYLAELEDVIIFGGTDLILVLNTLLYDEIYSNNKYKHEIKSRTIYKINSGSLTIRLSNRTTTIIEYGIHFAKDHCKPYLHFAFGYNMLIKIKFGRQFR